MAGITLEEAQLVITAAARQAQAIGQPMNIAIADEGGHLQAFLRMDGAWLGSINIAINKAFTARAFDLSTQKLAKLAKPGEPFYGIQQSNYGRVMIFPGGEPLQRNGRVVGAIGVSGGDNGQDQRVAEAGVEAFAQIPPKNVRAA